MHAHVSYAIIISFEITYFRDLKKWKAKAPCSQVPIVLCGDTVVQNQIVYSSFHMYFIPEVLRLREKILSLSVTED